MKLGVGNLMCFLKSTYSLLKESDYHTALLPFCHQLQYEVNQRIKLLCMLLIRKIPYYKKAKKQKPKQR